MKLGCVREGFFGKKAMYCDRCKNRYSYEACVSYRIKHKADKFSYNEFY